MQQVDRRSFLKSLGATGATIGVLGNGQAWALNRLEPIRDTLATEYPYRSWEDLYRNEWTWDKIGHALHQLHGQLCF